MASSGLAKCHHSLTRIKHFKRPPSSPKRAFFGTSIPERQVNPSPSLLARNQNANAPEVASYGGSNRCGEIRYLCYIAVLNSQHFVASLEPAHVSDAILGNRSDKHVTVLV